MIPTMHRPIYQEEHALYRQAVRKFIEREVTPNLGRWRAAGLIEKAFWLKAGEAGLICPTVPETYGGLGLDFRFNAILDEEFAYAGATVGVTLQSDITVDYILRYASEDQKQYILPRMISGETITAIAMTEPGTGSDLQGIRTTAREEGDSYILNGAKTFISCGQTADLIITVARTGAHGGGKGLSLFLVDSKSDGFRRGSNLEKIGQSEGDTSELFYENVRVPRDHLLGPEGDGFAQLMANLPQERLGIAISAQARAQRAFDEALSYTRSREAFSKTVFDFQNTRFVLAGIQADLQTGWASLDWAIDRHCKGLLTGAEAAASKLWHTEMHWKTVDAALQLHGGMGYMSETAIAQLWRDARVDRIYGGTSEIMKEVISRAL